MISDSQLNKWAISFGLISAGLILAYSLLENNTKSTDDDSENDKDDEIN